LFIEKQGAGSREQAAGRQKAFMQKAFMQKAEVKKLAYFRL
jgi:hypothetical protein